MRVAAIVAVAGLWAAAGHAQPAGADMDYPETKTVEQADTYHGTRVADPFRWLEADVRESAAVADWVARQNALTFDYLDGLPARAAIERRLRELWNYERYSVPVRKGGRYFFRRNDGLQNQAVLYVQDSLDNEPRLLIDPNQWSDDGTVALAEAYPSPDGRYLAYTVQDGGSDWRTARILDLTTGELLPERLEWLKFTNLSWLPDGSGFYYSRYPATDDEDRYTGLNRNQAVWFHAVGNPQADDREVYARPDHPDWGFRPQVSHDGRHLIIEVWLGTDERNQVVYQDLGDPAGEPEMLVEGFDAGYSFIGADGGELFFRSNAEAPMGRLTAWRPAAAATGGRWRDVVAEAGHVLTSASLIGGHLIAHYLEDAKSAVAVFDTDGRQVRRLDLPGIGTASGFSGDPASSETFFTFESFNNPGEIWHYDVARDQRSLFRRIDVDFQPDDYVVEQVFFTSRDGTRVPMFLIHRRGLKLNGDNPTLLYGYGGFNISLTPDFSVTRLAWLEMGGVYAVANLRGGGEYGEAWHEAGTRLDKQNVFDDFIAAAEHLVAENYTRPARLGIFGGSNGGLLVGAVLNQRPDLFGAAVPAVGVMDMLRFQHFTAGRFWTDDYGSADDPDEFRALHAYSPYHNIAAGVCYPPVLATTADTDDRVVPGHSFKYIARLQQAQGCENPVLIRVETRAGHGAGKPTQMIIEEYADRWAFLAEHLQLSLPADFSKEDSMSSERDAYIEKLKARLDEWNAEIARMEAKAREAQAEAKVEYEKAMKDMAEQRERAREQLRELQSASDAAWQEIRRGAETALDEMRQAWDKAMKQFK